MQDSLNEWWGGGGVRRRDMKHLDLSGHQFFNNYQTFLQQPTAVSQLRLFTPDLEPNPNYVVCFFFQEEVKDSCHSASQ